jgi:carbamoyl-phosphate synthase large subunit
VANIPSITTIQGLGAAVQGIAALKRGEIGVRSLQDWAKVTRAARTGDAPAAAEPAGEAAAEVGA